MTDKSKPPSFEDIMKAASRPPEPERKEPKKPAPPPPEAAKRKPSAPTFAEIIGSVELRPEDRAPRPPPARRPRKEERKMPVVVRRPSLGKREEAAQPPAAAPEEGSTPAGDAAAPEQGAAHAAPESAFAQPGADEAGDFAALFAESEKSAHKPQKLRLGQKVQARVAHVGSEIGYLDLGGKGEAIIDLRELRNDKGELLVQAGETVEAYVLSIADGTPVMTRAVPKGAGREVLQQALESKVPVEGTVTAQNKGGLEVDLGGLRAFCPASQIDVRFVEDPAQFVGQKLKFRVMEIRGGNAILSRRALLEEERATQAVELRKKLEVGAVLDGTVSSVRDFGAFVDLGGLEGLVHVSELSHQRVAHAQDVVKPGQNVRVQILRIEKDEKGHERIALSLRALEQDPWDAARPQLKEGARLQGKVARLQPFGAFVELFPGVDGLVHVSALSNRHVQHPREVVKEGETIEVQVESIDDAQKRVALRRISEEEAQAPAAPEKKAAGRRARVGDMVDAKVDRVEPYGVFVSWAEGKGLVPNAELGTPRGSDNQRTTPVGTQFKAQIVDIDERGRYRLSRTSAERSEGRSEYEAYRRKAPPPGKGFGTLGDLLRAKLQEQEQEQSEE
ncbi:MAG TPA: S1 RNA-binding domain-containing protein [Myxococcales bacterium]|jgi:small subunit ribosomal protein S1|nr:S1 RNA-binding domain-containing protein [Myxococcales bacterium]